MTPRSVRSAAARGPLRMLSAGLILRMLTLPLALLISGAMVWGASSAAFIASTSNPDNGWATGVVALSEDAGDPAAASALFNVDKVVPGFEYSRCITVVSNSSMPTRLKLYGGVTSYTPLAAHLAVTVEEGSRAAGSLVADPNCSTFVPAEQIYDGGLVGIGSDFASGISSAPDGYPLTSEADGGTRSYRITLALPESAPRTLENTHMGGSFIWEAQSVSP